MPKITEKEAVELLRGGSPGVAYAGLHYADVPPTAAGRSRR